MLNPPNIGLLWAEIFQSPSSPFVKLSPAEWTFFRVSPPSCRLRKNLFAVTIVPIINSPCPKAYPFKGEYFSPKLSQLNFEKEKGPHIILLAHLILRQFFNGKTTYQIPSRCLLKALNRSSINAFLLRWGLPGWGKLIP